MTTRYRELDEITHWAINDGRTCLGVVDLVDSMFTARDVAGNVIGKFASLHEAAQAFDTPTSRKTRHG